MSSIWQVTPLTPIPAACNCGLGTSAAEDIAMEEAYWPHSVQAVASALSSSGAAASDQNFHLVLQDAQHFSVSSEFFLP